MNALNLAKNIFVHGSFDKLHAQQKSYEETLEKFKRDKYQYLDWERNFNSRQWSSNGDRLREFYYLTKKKILLDETERNLAVTKIQLDEELARLKNLCQTEMAQEKIALLAANILFKNLKIAQEYETAKKLVKNLSEKLRATEKRFNVLDKNYSREKKTHVYRVIQPVSNSPKTLPLKENELTAIIADTLLGEEYAVQLVARFDGNNLEMEKDWEMMSELDKDELINKKMIREL